MNEWRILYEDIIEKSGYIKENIENSGISIRRDKKIEYENNNEYLLNRFILLFKEFDRSIKEISYMIFPINVLFDISNTLDKIRTENIDIHLRNEYLDNIFGKILIYKGYNSISNIDDSREKDNSEYFLERMKRDYESLQKEINKMLNKAKVDFNKTSEMHQKIQNLYHEYYSGNSNSAAPMVTILGSLSQDIKEKYDEVHDFYQKLITDEDSIRQQILSSRDTIIDRENNLYRSLKKLGDEIAKISSFHEEIYGDGKETFGIKKNIEDRNAQLSEFESEQKERYGALKKKIESLLPGATSAGLAKTYYDQKSSYDESITNNTYIFYGIIAVMFLASFVISTSDISFFPPSIEFVKINNIEDISSFLFFRLPVLLPLIWLAVFVSRRRSECERLKQEYTHKAALASSYESFKQQIKEIDGDKADVLMEKLLDSAINTISHNASLTLDKKADESIPIIGIVEKTVDKVLEKMPSRNKED